MTQEKISDLLSAHHSLAKGALKTALALICTPEMRNRRLAYLASVSQVKTIWQVDIPVDVEEFYYTQRIQTDSKTERFDSAPPLVQNGPVVVEGIAGQGKSILLRYLALRAAASGQHVPVFLQLRHIDKTATLTKLVKQAIEASIGPIEPLALEYLLRRRLIIFLLDGFDEIDTTHRSATIKEIHDFMGRYQAYPILVTARPNSDIQNSPMFGVAKIKPLTSHEQGALIEHLVEDVDTKMRLTNALHNKEHIAGVLTTPLLVTLLIITYKSAGEIPDQLSAFYKSLFATLLKRHDKMKPGFVRERRISLGDVDFERVFETLCFLALNDYKLSLDDRELHSYLRTSLASLNLEPVSEQDYATDLARVTCLLIQDGDRYHFLHKSIPEYFAAQKVAEERDTVAKDEFYRQLATSQIPENWYQSIFFLSEIDHLSYVELLLIPKLRELFLEKEEGDIPREMPRLTREIIMKMVGSHASLNVKRAGRDKLNSRLQTSSENWFSNAFLRQPLELSIQGFVDALPDDLAARLYTEASFGLSFDAVLDEISCWQKFLTHVNADPLLKQAYEKPLLMQQDISKRVRKTRPLFTLNTRRH
ncbi:NACHT domain-containing protein [Thiobacillus sp.]|uniref:NACHT domain-containing protein n=1 Tax=Thiobacillus sp. TaxID=924 RepID=UPI00286DC243|nr:NACHT domain-containing protein [Thiobacillus sp.]